MLRRIMLSLAILTGFMLAPVAVVSAGNFDDAVDNAQVGAGFGDASAVSSDTSKINTVIKTVVDILSILVGVLAVIMIIISGFKYVTSGGEGQKIAGAKSTLLYAIIGILIVALAQTIVWFVLGTATGKTTTPVVPSAEDKSGLLITHGSGLS